MNSGQVWEQMDSTAGKCTDSQYVSATSTEASSSRTIVRTLPLSIVNYNYEINIWLASVRRDGSFLLRSGKLCRAVFPSVSAGWKISGEEFMKDIKVINLLKLRASYVR